MKLTSIENQELIFYFSNYDFSNAIRNKTFLVTGSRGIVGSGIIKWLLFSNMSMGTNCHIIASTRNVEDIPSYIEANDNIEFCQFGAEAEYCVDREIDYIVHAAAPTSNKVFLEQPVDALNVILLATGKMLEIAKLTGAMMVYISSEEVYGTPLSEFSISEDYVGAIDSMSVRSCYPLGKKTAELLCKSYSLQYGVNVRIIRPTVILGLWQQYDSVKVEAEMLRCIMENRDFCLKTDGGTKKSVIYSLDAITAIFYVLFYGNTGEAYNATNPATFCSVRERAERLFDKFNPSVCIRRLDADNGGNKEYLAKRYLLEDISKIARLGWNPQRDIEDIFRMDIERFQTDGAIK